MAIDFKKLLAETKVSQPQNVVLSANSSTPPPPLRVEESTKDSVAAISTAPQVSSQTSVITPEVKAPPAMAPGVDSANNGLGTLNESAPAGAVVEYPGLHDLRDRIYALDKALLANHPAMDSLLQTIHRNLSKDPELIHLLKPEERAMIFAGLKKKTQTVIVTESVKSASSGKNRGLKNLSLEDL